MSAGRSSKASKGEKREQGGAAKKEMKDFSHLGVKKACEHRPEVSCQLCHHRRCDHGFETSCQYCRVQRKMLLSRKFRVSPPKVGRGIHEIAGSETVLPKEKAPPKIDRKP